MLSIKEALDYIEHALGGSLSVSLNALSIANRAGRGLCRAHPWQWLKRNSTTINFVADQTYIDAPSGLARVTGYDATSGTMKTLVFTTLQTIVELQTSTVDVDNFAYYLALLYAPRTGGGPPYKRFRIYPTPSADDNTGPITVYYDAEWTELTDDDEYVSIPEWMEDIYLEVLARYVKGYEEDDTGTVADRMELLKRSELWKDAVSYDSSVQPNIGPLRGGAVASGMRFKDWGSGETVSKV